MPTWVGGTIAVPSGTGSVSVTGLAAKPQFVVFYGVNFQTEDTVVTDARAGIFRGYAANKYDLSGIGQGALSAIPATLSNGFDTSACALLHPTTAGSWLYIADLTSFNSDGFTLDFTTAPGTSGYKIAYLASWGHSNAFAFDSVANATNFSGTDVGFAVQSGLGHANRQTTPGAVNTAHCGAAFGGGHFRVLPVAHYKGEAWVNCQDYPDSAAGQYRITSLGASSTVGGETGSFNIVECVGFFIPVGTMTPVTLSVSVNGTTVSVTNGVDGNNGQGGAVLWSTVSDTGTVTPEADADDDMVVSGLASRPEALAFYGISNDPEGQSNFDLTGLRPGAITMGFATKSGFQWCAAVDGYPSKQAYQSFQHAVCDVVDSTGVHTADVTGWSSNGFTLTTADDDVSPAELAFHAFDPGAAQVIRRPQIYRRVVHG